MAKKEKNTFYFSHDCNARNDEKLIAVRMRHGAEGYGIYFMIIERLMESTGYMSVKDYNVIAFDLRVSAEKVKSIIEDFELFSFAEDGRFFSESLTRRLEKMEEGKKQRREAGLKSAERRRKKNENSTDVERMLNDRSTDDERTLNGSLQKNEQIKGKENKEEEIIPPCNPPEGDLRARGKIEPVLSFEKIKEVLLADEEWRMISCRRSGMTTKFNDLIPEKLDEFHAYIKAIGEERTILTVSDVKRRFTFWCRDHSLKTYNQSINGSRKESEDIEFKVHDFR